MIGPRAIELPALSALEPEPLLPAALYERRLRAVRARMDDLGLDALLVYADREHYANGAFLTGFDPRFEEALIAILPAGDPVVITGNESVSLVPFTAIPTTAVLCQSLSLPAQARTERPLLTDALAQAGVGVDSVAGLVGWKPIPAGDRLGGEAAFAVPQFMHAQIASHCGRLVDATAVLMGLHGLRADSEADQLALNEHRATRASQHVWRALEAVRPGSTELEIAAAMRLDGLALACHVMCTSGADTVAGMRSPTDRPLAHGDRFSTAVGLWGGLTSRAGRLLHADEAETEAFAERFLAPYFGAVATWYESVRVGADAGAIAATAHASLAEAGLRPLLNPGHLVHLDEWLDSPFVPGQSFALPSGTALQCDIIPVGPRPGDAANVEDGLALADEELRAELRSRHPAMWARVERRRSDMRDLLGIDLHEDVLPFSDRQAMLPVGLLTPGIVLGID